MRMSTKELLLSFFKTWSINMFMGRILKRIFILCFMTLF